LTAKAGVREPLGGPLNQYVVAHSCDCSGFIWRLCGETAPERRRTFALNSMSRIAIMCTASLPIVATNLGRKVVGDVVDGGVQPIADGLGRDDHHHRDQEQNEAVFDRRGARLVFGEAREKPLHDCAPIFVVTRTRCTIHQSDCAIFFRLWTIAIHFCHDSRQSRSTLIGGSNCMPQQDGFFQA